MSIVLVYSIVFTCAVGMVYTIEYMGLLSHINLFFVSFLLTYSLINLSAHIFITLFY